MFCFLGRDKRIPSRLPLSPRIDRPRGRPMPPQGDRLVQPLPSVAEGMWYLSLHIKQSKHFARTLEILQSSFLLHICVNSSDLCDQLMMVFRAKMRNMLQIANLPARVIVFAVSCKIPSMKLQFCAMMHSLDIVNMTNYESCPCKPDRQGRSHWSFFLLF